MPAAQDAVILREGRDDAFHDIFRSVSSLVVADVQVLAANKADTQHDLSHGHEP
ncbi:MAG: hypothetical protein JWO75_1229 [Actinomycetia bacterium]|jgi:hypothetical protein|nr:hypothetical protein [Actinomycetes bacterium]